MYSPVLITGTKSINQPPKVGIFFNKEQKILQLEVENQSLVKDLQKLNEQYISKSNQMKHINTHINQLQTDNQLMQMESKLIEKSIKMMQEKTITIHPQLQELQKELTSLQKQNLHLQQRLFQLTQRQTQKKATIDRYLKQKKMQKMITKSQQSVVKVCEGIKKNCENYEKNYKILSDKLQSKKKYLNILLKKKQKEDREKQKVNSQKQIKGSSSKRQNFNTINHSKASFSNTINQEEDSEAKHKKLQSIKSYSSLIRKKNTILLQKK